MKVLRKIPTDGTFHQTQPSDRLRGKQECYSYDNKSAMDRWPLLVLFTILQFLFDRSFVSARVNSALACNIFDVPWVGHEKVFAL